MWVAGVDFDTHGIDLVLLDEDDPNVAVHHRWGLIGHDAFSRALNVVHHRSLWDSTAWRNVIALGIEDPRGASRTVDAPIYRVQGAILACAPRDLYVHPWKPQEWRKRLQIAHIGKEPIREFALDHWLNVPEAATQDALDAFSIAYATRMALVRTTVSV